MGSIKSVLFICTGNSCRSVMAEGLLRNCLEAAGRRDIEVRSCGTSAVNGMPPTDETLEVMGKEGIDVSAYRSKRASEILIKKSDLILTMGISHKLEIARICPDAAARTHLLKKFGSRQNTEESADDEVPDPIGRSPDFYKMVLDTIRGEIARISELL